MPADDQQTGATNKDEEGHQEKNNDGYQSTYWEGQQQEQQQQQRQQKRPELEEQSSLHDVPIAEGKMRELVLTSSLSIINCLHVFRGNSGGHLTTLIVLGPSLWESQGWR